MKPKVHPGTTRFILRALRGAWLLVLSICAIPLLAQQPGAAPQTSTASIKGSVSAGGGEGSANSLGGIVVNLTGPAPASTARTSVADADGHYEFTQLAAGSYTLEVSQDGFKPWTMTLTLSRGQAAVQDIVLQISSVNQQIQVRAEAGDIAATQSVSATSTVSEQQLETLPLPTAKFTEALSLSPAVIRTQEGKLNFKGQTESQGMLVVDSAENVDPVSGSFAIPIPVDAIQSMTVYNTPDSSEFGGFSGGLTRIELKPPPFAWDYKIFDFVPSFRGKNDHIVGVANWTPRVQFGGPLIKNKLNFSQEFTYEFRRTPVRGLTWPMNEIVTRNIVSFTQLQATLSSRHLLTVNVNVFPSRTDFANIDALIPQTASANYDRSGVSAGFTDSYQFVSGSLLSTVVRYTRFDSHSFGQGPEDMEINPEGWGGNFFNASNRGANRVEALPAMQLKAKSWHGSHEVRFGADFLYRSYNGSSLSHPINLVEQDGSLAEQITFQGAGLLTASDTEISEFVEDHWNLTGRFSLNYGARLSSQTLGRDAAFAPRIGAAYGSASGKTVVRASADLIYGHVPLLAANFADNQTRTLSFYSSGVLTGQPITLQNIYMPTGVSGVSTGSAEPGTSPRTFAWNVEFEREVSKDLSFRLGYLDSHTTNLFVVNQVVDENAMDGMLALTNGGVSQYRQAELAVHYKASDRADLNLSYVWSRARGDLNILSDTVVPFDTPVIRPNTSGVLSSDIPHRVIAWGLVRLPWKLVISPVADVHSGFPFSSVDVLQDYVGVPNSLRFPTYFSLDVKIYREFTLRLPFLEHSKGHKIRLGVYSVDITNHQNPHDVYNNVTSPIFGQFAGFQRRFDGMVIDFAP